MIVASLVVQLIVIPSYSFPSNDNGKESLFSVSSTVEGIDNFVFTLSTTSLSVGIFCGGVVDCWQLRKAKIDISDNALRINFSFFVTIQPYRIVEKI